MVTSSEKVIIEIPVEHLRVGLYVSRLDRPWSESPFLFQGFEIEQEEELAQLRSICRVVYVEVTVVEAEELARSALKSNGEDVPICAPDPFADLSALLDNHATFVPPHDPIPLQTELVRAKQIFGRAKQAVNQIFGRLQHGGGLDASLLDSVMDSMVDSVFRNRDALSWLARMKRKDDYLYNHSLSSSIWALAFGRYLALDKDTLKLVGIGAMLLDIGKTKLSDDLLKGNSKPSEHEWQELRAHVEHGLALVQDDRTVDVRIKQMIGTHHERIDGCGYPQQLKGDAIPLVGRIAGIVDCYDAMTSDRHYAKGKSTYDAVLELKKLGGTWFQSELVELFIQAVGVFPTGTLVELNTGEIGVVVAQSRFRRLRPEVMMILDANKKVRKEFTVIDLQMREQVSATGEPALWISRGLEPGAHGIDPTEYFL